MMLLPAMSFPACFGLLPERKGAAAGQAIEPSAPSRSADSDHPAIPGRIASIDTIKAIAIFAVICIHARPFLGRMDTLNGVIEQLCRFAVPFFFMAAGYLFALKIKIGRYRDPFKRYLGRMAALYGAWCAIYLLLPSPKLIAAHGILKGCYLSVCARIAENSNPLRLLFEGTADHLWFFASLISAFIVLYPFRKTERLQWLFFIAVPLYAVGLLAGSYSATPLGFKMEFDTRNGPFFSTLCVGLGFLLGCKNYRTNPGAALFLLSMGFAVHMTEALFLKNVFGVPLDSHDFLAGTVMTGLGLLFLATAAPELGKGSFMARCGKYTFGIYAIHLIADTAFHRTVAVQHPEWHIASPVIVFLISLSLVLVVARLPLLRRIVV